jgi:hypothetical protein
VKTESEKQVSRRETIHLLGVGLATGAFLALSACKQQQEATQHESPTAPTPAPQPQAAALDCNTPIDATSKNARLVMQYKNPAAIPEKHCSACSQFTAGKYGDCGGCKLFTGPVNPNGGCLSFAPLAGAPAPAKSG